MSAMSASSPPAGLRGLSLITEHKSSVPPTVQSLPRTPEKMAVSQQTPASNLLVQPQQPAQVSPLSSQPAPSVQPPAVESVKPCLPVAVANGMELTQPPVSFPSTEVPQHQTAAMETTPTLLPPPPAHLPNLPCGSKGEQDRTNDVPPTPNQENNSGEMSESAEAPASDFSQQPPVSAATEAAPNHQPAIPEPSPQEQPIPVQIPAENPQSPKHFAAPPPQAEPQDKPAIVNSVTSASESKQPTESQPEKSVTPQEPSKDEVPQSDSSDSSEKPAEAPEPEKKEAEPQPGSKDPEVDPKSETEISTPSVEQPKSETPPKSASQTRAKRQPKPPAEKKKKAEPIEEPSTSTDDKSDTDENGKDKPKRMRRPTEPYQSWNSERTLIAQITKTIEKVSKTQPQNEKLIVFYRNEFLAVRSVEGGFYICQAMQNIYRTSQRIKIRWLSQESNSQNYTPDFYDHTEFDCILTNLNLERIGKDKFRLPEVESQRTQSILKRAMDVESGAAAPSDGGTLTEEHPDGLDLSLYRNEDQLKKRKKGKRKGSKKKIVAEVSSVKRAALARVIKKRGVGASSSSTVTGAKAAASSSGADRKPTAAPSRASSRRGAALAKRKAFAEAASKRAAAGITAPQQSSSTLSARRSGGAVGAAAMAASKTTTSTATVGASKTTVSSSVATKRKAPASAGVAAPEKRARVAGKTRSGVGAASANNTATSSSGGGVGAAKASNAASSSSNPSSTTTITSHGTTANATSTGSSTTSSSTASASATSGSGSSAGSASTVTRRALRNAK